jgi:hypothetical protein
MRASRQRQGAAGQWRQCNPVDVGVDPSTPRNAAEARRWSEVIKAARLKAE